MADCSGWHVCSKWKTVDAFEAAQKHLLVEVQQEAYQNEIQCLQAGKCLPKSSSISKLSPFIGIDGLLRVGGRLKHSSLTEPEKHPILVPGRHHIAILIVRHYHEQIKHQGRHITEGSIRSAGFWITGAKSLVSSVIYKCVKCQKLRGNLGSQKMADLPSDRLETGPPFTNVGVDCFGPWQIVTRKTRGGQACSKRWAVMFTCLTIRAVHIEVVEELSSSAFINALRRFMAIRGQVKLFRSDRGTNFVGSTDNLGINAINVEDSSVKQFLYSQGCTWLFNPPHASHMGGVWERVIGISRKILDSLLTDVPGTGLTHELLSTFLAEVSAIMNARPLVPLTTDAENPVPLSPSLLLTQKPQQITSVTETSDSKDLFRKEWKRVQALADMFWHRWKAEYLQTLQQRKKWHEPKRNLCEGDVVLVRDKQTARNDWPLGIIHKTFPSSDGLIRKCEVRVVRDGRSTLYTRPIAELVLLLPC